MTFRVFGYEITITKEHQFTDTYVRARYNEATDLITNIDPWVAKKAWKKVMWRFPGELEGLKIPIVKAFREEYKNIRGAAPSLQESKKYAEDHMRVISLDNNKYSRKWVLKKRVPYNISERRYINVSKRLW